MKNNYTVIIHGAPGCGKTTVSALLHEKLKCPWFEFGWIPEFNKLNQFTETSYYQECEMTFETLVLVSKNYIAHGFERVILSDIEDRFIPTLPQNFGIDGYKLFTLYSENDDIIKNRILTRDNGNTFKNWESSIMLNQTIIQRKPLHNEVRIRSDNQSAEQIAGEILGLITRKESVIS